MFLMYVDECGDSGMGIGSSDYFILSGMVIHESMWTQLRNFLPESQTVESRANDASTGPRTDYGISAFISLATL